MNKRQYLPPNIYATYDYPEVDGKQFTAAARINLREIPQDLQPRNMAEKQIESLLCFLVSVFSNLHKSPFQIDGTQYSCTEQYIQCSKA